MATVDDSMIERMRAAAAVAIADDRVPGIAIGIVSGGELQFSEGFGAADIETRVPMRPEHRQRIASITKTMVGLCTMALVDEGRLSLEDRVSTLLPEVAFHGPGDQITIRHILTHTSGIGEAPTLETLADAVDPNRPPESADRDFSDAYPNGIVVEAEPGTKWAYANNGFALLGEILVRAEGASLDEILTRRIFAPLGMKDSDCLDGAHPALATGYHRAVPPDQVELLARAGRTPRDEQTVDGLNIRGTSRPEFDKVMLATGGVQSTVPDMARYAGALLAGGGGIVRPETFRQMIAPHWCPDGRLISWGLAFARTPRYGRQMFGHTGSYFGGWNSSLAVSPEDGLAVITHLNVMLDEAAPLFDRILRAVLDEPPVVPPSSHIDADLLRTAPGVFEAKPGKLTNFRTSLRFGRVQLVARDGELWAYSRRGAWKRGARLTPTAGGDPAFLLAETGNGKAPGRMVIERDAAGKVVGLRTDELVHLVRTDQVAPWVIENEGGAR